MSHDNKPKNLALAYSIKRNSAKKMSKGGSVKHEMSATASEPVSRPDKGWGAIIVKNKGGEIEDHKSIAAAIMAKRKNLKEVEEMQDVDMDDISDIDELDDLESIMKENYDEKPKINRSRVQAIRDKMK